MTDAELERYWSIAVRDDWHMKLIGSDVRVLIREIQRHRALLREVIDSAWEMEWEDRHTVDSDVIGKVATAILSFSSTERPPSEIVEGSQ